MCGPDHESYRNLGAHKPFLFLKGHPQRPFHSHMLISCSQMAGISPSFEQMSTLLTPLPGALGRLGSHLDPACLTSPGMIPSEFSINLGWICCNAQHKSKDRMRLIPTLPRADCAALPSLLRSSPLSILFFLWILPIKAASLAMVQLPKLWCGLSGVGDSLLMCLSILETQY